MLVQRQTRCSNIETTLAQFIGSAGTPISASILYYVDLVLTHVIGREVDLHQSHIT